MGATFEALTPGLREFVERQHVFFVATAPLSADGHVNVSPKGYDTFRVLDERTICYLDLSGSGAETIAHVRENGRITIMCCAFEGKPNIVRLYGSAEALTPTDPDFQALLELFPPRSGARAIIVVKLSRVSSTCGFAVPFMDYVADRDRLEDVFAAKDPDALAEYWAAKNQISIDGLPALPKTL